MNEPVPLELDGVEPATAALVGLIMRVLSGDYSARGEVSGTGEGFDPVIAALNMMCESLEREAVRRAEAEAQLADAVDSYELAPDGFCSCEIDTLRIIKCNGALARALGRPRSEVMFQSLLDLVLPASRAPLKAALKELEEHGVTRPLDVELATDGPRVIASVTAAMKHDSSGPSGGGRRFLLSLRDETASRILQESLAKAERLEAVGRLAGGVAHDFNNILTVILTSADFLAQRLADRHDEQAEVVMMRDAARRAALLVKDLLAFARHESVPMSPIVADDAIRQAQPMLERLVGDRTELVFRLEADRAAVLTGKGHLIQALVNLVVNARDAVNERGHIVVATRRRTLGEAELALRPRIAAGEYVEILVQDDGAGINAELQARIFEPFFTTKPVGAGTGLGLSIVYGVVRRAHGSVRVQSTVGGGTTFELLFPVVSA